MKFLRRSGAAVMAAVILAGASAFVPLINSAAVNSIACADEVNPSEYELTYSINDDGTAVVTGCTGTATKIVIPSETEGHKVVAIGDNAFKDNKELISISIPESITTIAETAFDGCSIENVMNQCPVPVEGKTSDGYTYTAASSQVTLTKYSGSLTALTTPSEICGQKVTAIGSKAFYNNKKLRSLTVSSGVKSIGSKAFGKCIALTSITIPEGAEAIASNTLTGCTALTSIINNSSAGLSAETSDGFSFTVTNNTVSIDSYSESTSVLTIPSEICGLKVTRIGEEAFHARTDISTVILPDTLKVIGEKAFYDNTGLTGIIIPNGVTTLEYKAFRNCTNLTDLTIPSSIKTVGDDALTGCSKLTNVHNGSSFAVTATASNGFSYVSRNGVAYIAGYSGKLKAITVPSKIYDIPVKGLAESAFAGCTNLTSVTVPGFITSIPENSFGRCTKLTTVKLPSTLTYIGPSAFDRCSKLTSINIPSGVKTIGYGAFYGCKSLTSISFSPKTVSDSFMSAFDDCGSYYVKSITTGDNTTTISEYAFADVSSLTSLTVGKNVTKIQTNALKFNSALKKLTFKGKAPAYSVTALQNRASLKIYYQLKYAGTFSKMKRTFSKCTWILSPVTLTVKSTASKANYLSWNAVETASCYEIYYSTAKSGTYKKLATVKSLGYTHKNLKKGKSYYYKVRAIKGKTKCTFSAVKGCKAK